MPFRACHMETAACARGGPYRARRCCFCRGAVVADGRDFCHVSFATLPVEFDGKLRFHSLLFRISSCLIFHKNEYSLNNSKIGVHFFIIVFPNEKEKGYYGPSTVTYGPRA